MDLCQAMGEQVVQLHPAVRQQDPAVLVVLAQAQALGDKRYAMNPIAYTIVYDAEKN